MSERYGETAMVGLFAIIGAIGIWHNYTDGHKPAMAFSIFVAVSCTVLVVAALKTSRKI